MTENKIVRVCAKCQQIKGIKLKYVPDVIYSHGACYVHALDKLREILGSKRKAKAYLANKPTDYFVPELDSKWIA